MDLTRIGDPKYIAEMVAAQRSRGADAQYVAGRIEVLEQLAKEWSAVALRNPAAQEPPNISINESVAIKLALHREGEFKQPVAQFIALEPWQQAWVLRKWRMESYIGRKLGVAE